MAVVKNDGPSVAAHEVRELNDAVRRRNHRLPKKGANINP